MDPELEWALHHLELNKLRGLDFNSNLHMELERTGLPHDRDLIIIRW